MMIRTTMAACVLMLTLAVGCDEPVDTRPAGLTDESAMRACDHVGDAPTAITISADMAAPTEIALSDSPYLLTLPAGAGYAAVHTLEMHNNVALYTRERDALSEFAPGLGSSRPNGICPTELQDDFRVHIHNPAEHLLTFSAEGPREVLLIAQLHYVGDGPPPGHDHDAGEGHEHDAGEGHEHDGGHEHDHDAGAEHDHDAG